MESIEFNKMGETALSKRDYPMAVQMLSKSINCEPSHSAYSNRAFAYFNLKQHDLAVEDYLAAIKFGKEKADEADSEKNFKQFNEWLISLARDLRSLALVYNESYNFKEAEIQCGSAIVTYGIIRSNSYPIRDLDIAELYTIRAFSRLYLKEKNREGAVDDFAMAYVEASRSNDEIAIKNITQQILIFGLQVDVAKAVSIIELLVIKKEKAIEQQVQEERIYVHNKLSFQGETSNAIFRDMIVDDVPYFFAVYNDKAVTKYLKQQHFTEEEISDWFKEMMLYQNVNLEILSSIFCKADNAFAGLIRVDLFKPIEDSISNPWIRDPVPRITKGCIIEAVYILEKYQNSSIVTEILPLLLKYLKSIGIVHVFTEIRAHNIVAKKVLDKFDFKKVSYPDYKSMDIPLKVEKIGIDAEFFYKNTDSVFFKSVSSPK